MQNNNVSKFILKCLPVFVLKTSQPSCHLFVGSVEAAYVSERSGPSISRVMKPFLAILTSLRIVRQMRWQ